MKINKTFTLLSSLLLATTIITGCSSGNGSSGKTINPPGPIASTDKQPITISPMGSIPLTGVGHKFSVRINNASDDDYILSKIEMIDPLTGKSALEHMALNSASCEKIAKNSYCIVQVTPKINKSAAFIVKATLTSAGKKEVVSQMIRVSDKIKARNGVYFDNDIKELMASAKGKYSLVLPMVLDDDFKSLKVSNGFINCESNAKGSACTYILNGSINGDKTMVATNVEGVHKNGRSENLIKSDTLVRTNNPDYSHILLSQPEDIVANTDGSHNAANIVAFNLGNQKATGIALEIPQGFAVTNTCRNPNVMDKNETCVLNVTLAPAQNEFSLAGSLTVRYTGGNTPKIATAGLFYDASALGLGLEIDGTDRFFISTLTNTTKQTDYTIKNTGSKIIKDIKVNFTSNDLTAVVDPNCPDDLVAGQVCKVTVSYAPTQEKNAAFAKLAVTGVFEQTGNITKSIYVEKAIEYSAVTTASLFQLRPDFHPFVAVTNDSAHVREYTIVNISNYPAQFAPSPTIAATGLQDQNEFGITNNGCAQLIGGDSCIITAKFAPINTYDPPIPATITVPLASVAGSTAPEPLVLKATLHSTATATNPPNIVVSTAFSNAPFATFGTPLGQTTVNSIKFAMFSGREVRVIYTFKNDNNALHADAGAANNFNVATAGIFSGFLVDTDDTKTTCPTGTNRATLAAGAECKVEVIIPKERYFTSGLLFKEDINSELKLGYSFENFNQGATPTYVPDETSGINVVVTTKLVTNTTLRPSVRRVEGNPALADGYYIDLNVVLGNVIVDPSAGAEKAVYVSASIKGVPPIQSNRCEVGEDDEKDCNNIIVLPLAFPAGDHYLDVTIAHKLDSTIKEHKVVRFTIPDPVNP